MRLLSLFTIFVTADVAFCTNPGARLIITQSFLDYGKQIGISVLNEEIKGLKIPDVHGSAGKSVDKDSNVLGNKGLFDYDLTNIAITQFSASADHASITLSPPTTAGFTTSSISAAIHLNYKVKVGSGWFSISKSGNIDASATGVSFNLAIALSQSGGRPHLTPHTCSAVIGHLGLTFHGDIVDSILNLFEDQISHYLKGKLNDIICEQVSKLISNQANGVLGGIPISIPITSGFSIDYSLTSNPAVVRNAAYIDVLGEIWYTNHHHDNGIPVATHFPSVSCSSMFCVLLDAEEVLGSTGYAAQISGILHYDLDKSILSGLPGGLSHYLDCACTNGACVGALIPQIQSKCSAGSAVTIHMVSTMAPTAQVNATGAFVSFAGDLTFIGVTPGGERTQLFVAHITLLAGIPSSLNFNGWTISGEVHVVDAQLTVKSSQVGAVDADGLNELWQLAMVVVVEGELNKITSAGISLPSIPYFNVVNPNLSFGSRTLKLDAGLSYTGPIKKKNLTLAQIVSK